MLRCVNAEIISIGTELTAGLTVDTNAAWLSGRLAMLGVPVKRHITVPDEVKAVHDAIAEAAARADLILISGGLGPTPDDITREALADAMGRPLVSDPAAVKKLRAFFAKLDRRMSPSNERQAQRPEGSTFLENSEGTAPGIRAELGEAIVYVMPGVPSEMRTMFIRVVEPELISAGEGASLLTHTLHCFGAAEAAIADRIADLMSPDADPLVGITAHQSVITIRITAHGDDAEAAQRAGLSHARIIRDRLGTLVFGEGEQTLSDAVLLLLTKARHTVATAESCTGGLLAKMLTDVPGSSAYFLGGTVAYADDVKTSQLSVPHDLILRHGAVSEEIAAAMADGCRQAFGAQIGLSTTGIAGPGGGSASKPVGLVYIAVADSDGGKVRRCLFPASWDRRGIRDRACKATLNLLRLRLIDRAKPPSGQHA